MALPAAEVGLGPRERNRSGSSNLVTPGPFCSGSKLMKLRGAEAGGGDRKQWWHTVTAGLPALIKFLGEVFQREMVL